MSVRRLGPDQPASFEFTEPNLAWARATIAKYPPGKQASAVLPVLWRAQEQNDGWISRAAMEYVGRMLDMAYIRVYEIATFYTMFQLSPVGSKAHIQVCGTTPCMLRGAEDLKAVCRRKISPDAHQLSDDGAFSWEEVECLGACVNAPMVQIFKDTYEDLTPQSFEELIDDIAAGRAVKPGPQNGRQLSAPEGGATTLLDTSLYDKARVFERVEAPPPPPPAQPPSNAAKPEPAAPETAPAVKSPSPVKAAAETAAAGEKGDRKAETATAPIATAKRKPPEES
jgi:NADH-quinone oxidoreductase subunit E